VITGSLVALVHPGRVRDAYGALSPAGPSYEVRGCRLAPGDTTEREDRATTVTTTHTLYAPAGSVFPTTARVEVGGIVAEVDGDPEVWPGRGVVVRLKRVKG
jgi:hypothetical protein